MKNTIGKSLIASLAVFTVLFTSCNSSEELLHPQSATVTQNNRVKFIEDVTLNPSVKTLTTTSGVPGVNYQQLAGIPDSVVDRYAGMMGLFPQSISNYILYKFIDDWYGVKYTYGGSDKTGIDCSGFVQKVYAEVFCTDLLRTAREQFSACKMIFDQASLKEGDLVFFKTRGKRISHVGIYLANNFFVHASTSGGVMISSLTEAYWSHRFAGAGVVPKGNLKKDML